MAGAVAMSVVDPVFAQSLTFMTWNINGVEADEADLERFAKAASEEVGPVDVLVLQEIISQDQVAVVAEAFDLEYHVISDFSPPPNITGSGFRSLEVAVLSRLPITAAMEWDTTGQEPTGDGFPPRVSSDNIVSEEVLVEVNFGESRPSRGFLRADLEGGWSVYAVHWKSSRGASCNAADLNNAEQREDQAEGLVANASGALQAGRTIVVAGDYNIQAPGRSLRVGTNLEEDCNPSGSCEDVCGPQGRDGYDDSIHMLLSVHDRAELLSAALPETFIARFFPGGAIDHILVAGPMADEFESAITPDTTDDRWFGSDHRPVLARVNVEDNGSGSPGGGDAARMRELISEIQTRLNELEELIGPDNQ